MGGGFAGLCQCCFDTLRSWGQSCAVCALLFQRFHGLPNDGCHRHCARTQWCCWLSPRCRWHFIHSLVVLQSWSHSSKNSYEILYCYITKLYLLQWKFLWIEECCLLSQTGWRNCSRMETQSLCRRWSLWSILATPQEHIFRRRYCRCCSFCGL